MKLVIIHQHDPTVPNVAGIGTFIDAFIRNAPKNIEVDLIGVSAQPDRYPVGQWHSISLGNKSFRFFPLLASNPIHAQFIPLTIKMLWMLYRYKKSFDLKNAVLEFHRVEYIMGFLTDRNPKVLFLHGHHKKDYYNKKTEVRWGKFPWLYFLLEKKLLPKANHIHIVREDAVRDYKKYYPQKAREISFLSTWVDETIFYSANEEERLSLRKRISQDHNIAASSNIFLFVGRYEGQKDPLRLLKAFNQVRSVKPDAVLFLIGEGSLKVEMMKYIEDLALSSAIHFLQPMSQHEIAKWMNVADALCLSSAYEGMPCVILEALFCGLPVVSTAVGEAWRLIGDSKGGLLVQDEGAGAFAKGMIDLIEHPPTRESCRRQVESFTAKKVLAPVYQQHCELLNGA